MQEMYSTNMRILISVCTCLFILLGLLCRPPYNKRARVCTQGDLRVHLYSADRRNRICRVGGVKSHLTQAWLHRLLLQKHAGFTGVGYDLVRCKVSNLSLLGPSHSIRMHYFIKRGPIPPLTSPHNKKRKKKKNTSENKTNKASHWITFSRSLCRYSGGKQSADYSACAKTPSLVSILGCNTGSREPHYRHHHAFIHVTVMFMTISLRYMSVRSGIQSTSQPCLRRLTLH